MKLVVMFCLVTRTFADDLCTSAADCSLSFLQTRGTAILAQRKATRISNLSTADTFCCYSSASDEDTCGSCYPDAIAKKGDFCDSRSTCGDCGGRFCESVCCMSGRDASNICGTCWPTAIAEANTFCAASKDNCITCKGSWCTHKVSTPTQETTRRTKQTTTKRVTTTETETTETETAAKTTELPTTTTATTTMPSDEADEDLDTEIESVAGQLRRHGHH